MAKSIRQLWTNKLTGCRDNANSTFVKKIKIDTQNISLKKQFSGIILGIDPSLRGTGVAIIDFSQKDQPNLIFSKRVIIPQKYDFIESISMISQNIANIIEDNKNINFCSMEQTIFVQNYQIAQILGAVRGAIISVVSRYNIKIAEYAPLRIKQATVGTGKASKEQVSRTIKNLLNIQNLDLTFDETDAIAAGLCHAWTTKN